MIDTPPDTPAATVDWYGLAGRSSDGLCTLGLRVGNSLSQPLDLLPQRRGIRQNFLEPTQAVRDRRMCSLAEKSADCFERFAREFAYQVHRTLPRNDQRLMP